MEEPSTIICPLCRFPIGYDRWCTNPACHAPLDKGDWALPDVYGASGLLPPESANGPFGLQQPLPSPSEPGKVLSRLPRDLDPLAAVIHVGGSNDNHIRIAGAASPHQISFHLNRKSKDWWVFDWGNGSDATINGERFRNQRLKNDDIIRVAGVQLHYRSGRVAAEYGTADGVDLVVAGLTDARMSRGDSPHPLLDRISFAIPDGEFVGVIGPSGCGKSTLIKALAGLVKPAAGSITFNGVSRLDDSAGIRACTAYLPQKVDETLHDDLVLDQEIASYSAIHLAERDTAREDALLRILSLSQFRESRIGDLSGGQRRRAAFLLTMLRDPSVLLLDEPAAGLDRATETALMEDLRQMTRSGARKTILCATHELANIHLFDRVLVMTDGQIVYNGPPADLFDELRIPGDGDGRFQMLYKNLAEVHCHPEVLDGIRKNKDAIPQQSLATQLPETPRRPGRFSCLVGYLGRFARSFVAFSKRPVPPPSRDTCWGRFGYGLRQVTKWAFNPPLVGFVWQPLVVAFCLCVALKGSYGEDDPTVFFCAAIAAFWLGMSGSVRSLVSTRAGRCLERLEGVSRTSYLSAGFSSSLSRGLLQGLALSAFLYLLPMLDGRQGQWSASAAIGIGGCIVAAEWMGGFVGLALSAIAPSETFAVTTVPNLAVVALFFSEPLMGKNEIGLFAKILPAHAAYRTMESLNDSNCAPYAFWILPAATLAWLAASLAVTFIAQTLYERNWKG